MVTIDPTGIHFPLLKNNVIIQAAKGHKTEYVPVWIMRQAGRYLPEFRELRKKYEFFVVCQTPELACQVTLQPIDHFDLDAAIIFSDILVVPQALGMEIEMVAGKGPVFLDPLQDPSDMLNLNMDFNIIKHKLKYVFEAITLTRHKLNGKVPLIGFSGGPWTLMAYMIEGGSSSTHSKSKSWLYKYPVESHKLLQFLSVFIAKFLLEQIFAGAQMLQVFESHAGVLSVELIKQFLLPYLKNIVCIVKEELTKNNLEVPIVIFAKDAHFVFEELSNIGYDVISLDWTVNPKTVRKLIGKNVSLQGNLDPCALYASKINLAESIKKMLNEFGTEQYIANLGHGIYPDMTIENVKEFVDVVHSYSRKMNNENICLSKEN